MTTDGIDAAALSDQLDAVGVEQNSGETTGYLDLGSPLNLNAIAIGLGLENIAYEPEKFPGLIYHQEEPLATVVLFDSGVITTIDAEDDEAATTAIMSSVERLTELGLVESTDVPSEIVDSDAIPIRDVDFA